MIIRNIFILFLLGITTAFAQTSKTGEFIITSTPAEILGQDAAQYNDYIATDDNISWEIYVPENYDASNPAGVMVYAGAPNDVRPPVGWLSAMKDSNLIWVAARRSGNGSSIHQKKLLAMLSVPMIQKEYNIDDSRIYISGEGRTASRTALEYPEMFNGAILLGGKLWEDNADEKLKKALKNRYVFVTRERHIVPQGNRYAYNKFKAAGVENIQLHFLRGRQRFDRRDLLNSIEYLDQ
ncbi:hypothetical protein [Pseudemcibacter aquimaris]|uniref:hypothetical protein n=1 Tax=Pseudemcibacter aquimaris TaxID=2857064 RepID=UPI0020110F0C|nr:hypothetical protein [Pseudemcibacter aquimaris]MCC3860223.1 hypothetical protein [Pseudemcibacter aquimaris]WDU57548.1 hypothetical protein KW060_10110 [Pseudemcibacter aquimaris]